MQGGDDNQLYQPEAGQPMPGESVSPDSEISEQGNIATQNNQPILDQPQQAEPINPTPPSQPPIEPDIGSDGRTITWDASEFIHHEKTLNWYLGLAGVIIISGSILYFAFRDIFAVVSLSILGFVVGVVAARKPQVKKYGVNQHGLQVEDKFFSFDRFKSFSVVDEGAFSSIVFASSERFMPLVTVYVAPEDKDKILDLISQILPYEEYQPDFIDRLMSRIRF